MMTLGRRRTPNTGRWRVLRWSMTEEDAADWARKEGIEIERVENSREDRTDVDGRHHSARYPCPDSLRHPCHVKRCCALALVDHTKGVAKMVEDAVEGAMHYVCTNHLTLNSYSLVRH